MFPLLLRRYKHLYHVGKSFSKISCKLSVLRNESVVASMDWKRSILWLDIGNAILVKTCYDDLRHKTTETVLIKKKNCLKTSHAVQASHDYQYFINYNLCV